MFNPIWVFPKIGIPQNGWFIMENRVKMDDLEVFPYFRKHLPTSNRQISGDMLAGMRNSLCTFDSFERIVVSQSFYEGIYSPEN